jgi:hypothetical protein
MYFCFVAVLPPTQDVQISVGPVTKIEQVAASAADQEFVDKPDSHYQTNQYSNNSISSSSISSSLIKLESNIDTYNAGQSVFTTGQDCDKDSTTQQQQPIAVVISLPTPSSFPSTAASEQPLMTNERHLSSTTLDHLDDSHSSITFTLPTAAAASTTSTLPLRLAEASTTTASTDLEEEIIGKEIRHPGEEDILGGTICNVCAKECKSEAELKHHKKRHKVDAPMVCQYCPRQFVDKHKFGVHVRWHTGETPFKCHICGKGFRDDRKMRLHVARHNSSLANKCHLCPRSFEGNNNFF